jgi:ribonuclease P protein component
MSSAVASRTQSRLRKHADYQRVYKAGRKQFGRQMAWFVAPRDAESSARSETAGPRIGLTVPKALGNAVARNRIKRRLREAVREALPLLSAPVDLVLHPRRSVLEAEFGWLQREIATIFRNVQNVQAQNVQAQSVQAAAEAGSAPPATPRKPQRPRARRQPKPIATAGTR